MHTYWSNHYHFSDSQSALVNDHLSVAYGKTLPDRVPLPTTPHELCDPLPEHRLKIACIHVIAAKGLHSLMTFALDRFSSEADFDIDAKDARMWTAAHHAAVAGNRAMLDLLYSYGASPISLNDRNGTPEDLYSHCWPIPTGRHPSGELCFNTTFCHPSFLIRDWHTPIPDDDAPYGPELAHRFERFRHHEPRLRVTPLAVDEDGKPAPQVGAVTVLEGEARRGDIICTYTGQIYEATVGAGDDNTYTMHLTGNWGVDGRHGGAITRAPDGAPNVQVFCLTNCEGLPRVLTFVALRTLRNETVYLDYGSNHLAKAVHIEMQPKSLSRWLNTFSMKKFIADLTKSDSDAPFLTQVDLQRRATMLRYILHTPSTLFMLLQSGALTVDVYKQAFLTLSATNSMGSPLLHNGLLPLLNLLQHQAHPLLDTSLSNISRAYAATKSPIIIVMIAQAILNSILAASSRKAPYSIDTMTVITDAMLTRCQSLGVIAVEKECAKIMSSMQQRTVSGSIPV